MNVLAPWANYFIAQAGAAGALTGLIFVALSFNFDQIIAEGAWLDRAAGSCSTGRLSGRAASGASEVPG